MEQVSIIGLDLAKRSFQAHGALADGGVAFRKKLSREKVLAFFAEQPHCVVAMEACGSAHHWGRAIRDLGHEVRLIPPAYVKPFVKRQKNDAADAEAIAEAAVRPTMRFVAVKTEEQQGRAMLFRTRDLMVRQRTQLINALRGHLSEHGVVAAQGPANVKVLAETVEDQGQGTSLPLLVVELARVFLDQIEGLSKRISELEKVTVHEAACGETTRRLQTMPGVGPITALAIETFAPPMDVFKRGRDFAAWLGLAPRQHSTGGKQVLGKISKMGQRDIRRLLIIGAWPSSARPRERSPGGKLAAALAGAQTKDAGGDCARQQDGPVDLGHAGEGGGLSASCGCGGLIDNQPKQPEDCRACREVDER